MTLNEQEIYAKCLALGMTPAGAAGCTANILAESAGRPDNLQDCYNNSFGVSDAEYVRQVDAGVRGFCDSGGFGLCQWTSSNRKAALLSYAQGKGKSIADADMQFQFMGREMRESYAYIPANTKAQSEYRGNQAIAIFRRCSGMTPVVPSKDESAVETFWPPRTICKGMNGADVSVLQALLLAHGYTVVTVNGVFGDSLDKTVRKYQNDHLLAVDGIVGKNTWASLLKV